METKIVEAAARKQIIAPSPGFKKKKLAEFHVEALLFCQYSCVYCSSNAGMALKNRKRSNSELVRARLGREWNPHDASDIAIAYKNFVEELDSQLDRMKKKPGHGKTLVFSMLTDGFSPLLVNTGTTKKVLDLLLAKTDYRIRILTKNATVGSTRWINYFAKHRERFIVGLSTGSLNPSMTTTIELGTSKPRKRIEALRKLQDAHVPTFGMLCPVFPEVLETGELEELITLIRPNQCENVWSEVYNERHNWKKVRGAYPRNSNTFRWMTDVYEAGQIDKWSSYAADLYERLITKARAEGWADRLIYLLYEEKVTTRDAERFDGLEGVSLQSRADRDTGMSKHPVFRLMKKS